MILAIKSLRRCLLIAVSVRCWPAARFQYTMLGWFMPVGPSIYPNLLLISATRPVLSLSTAKARKRSGLLSPSMAYIYPGKESSKFLPCWGCRIRWMRTMLPEPPSSPLLLILVLLQIISVPSASLCLLALSNIPLRTIPHSGNSSVSVHFPCLSFYGTKQSWEFIDTYFVRVRI